MYTNVDEKTLNRLLKTHTVEDTARLLGVSRSTIQRAKKIYGIERDYRQVIDSIPVSQKAHNVLYGSLLGDGHVHYKDSVNKEAYYRAEHGVKQKDYLYWKYSALKEICASEPKESKRNGVPFSYYFQTRCHSHITTLYSIFYKDGKRILPRNFEHDINPEMLAVWYMDDGTYNSHSEICTQGFEQDEVGRILATFRLKFNIDCNTVHRKGFGMDIQFSKEGTKVLHDLIRPYIHPSMEYKLYPCNDCVVTPRRPIGRIKRLRGKETV